MKKFYSALLSFIALGVLAACGTSAESIELDETSVELEVGESATVSSTVEPEDASQDVEWSSDDEDVATVEDGEITAVAGGSNTITATSTENEDVSADVDVTVIPDPESISLSPETMELEEGESETLEASITPEDADQEVTYESDDEDVATVDGDEVTAEAAGETTITVTSEADDGVSETASITVVVGVSSVEDAFAAEVDDEVTTEGVVTGFAYNGYFIEDDTDAIFVYDEEDYYEDVEVGDEVQLSGVRSEYEGLQQIQDLSSLEVLESDVELPDVVDMSDVDLDDEDALEAYQSHRVGLEGYRVDSVSSDDYDNLTFDLYSPFDDYSMTMHYDSRLELSDDDEVFDLEENDLLDLDGMHLGWYDGPQLTYNGDDPVSENDSTLELDDADDNDELEVDVSGESEREWVVQPQASFDGEDVDYESSDEDVATVDDNGLLTVEDIGETTLTTTSQDDSDVSEEVTLVVTSEDLEVVLNDELNDDDQLTLNTEEVFDPDYTVSPEFVSQDVTMTSDDEAVVDVTEEDELEAVDEGTTDVTITSDADPDTSLTVEVLVEDPEPTLDFIESYEINEGDEEFEILQDVTAEDPIDGDLTDDVEVTDDDGFDATETGTYEIDIAVTNSFDNTDEGTISVEVIEEGEVIEASGQYNFQYAEPETRNELFADAERYLLETGYGGIPSTSNAGYVLYSDRLELPVEDPVPVLDYGTLFGSMSEDDSEVEMDDGDPGEEGEYTYRTAETSDPGQFNAWLAEDSISSDIITLFQDSLYYFDFNDDKTGYEVVPGMADGMPTPIDGEENEYGTELSDEWEVDVRDDLEWYFHEDIDTEGYSETIDAQDFIDTFKLALEENWFRAVSGGGDFDSAPQTIENAQAFADGEADWEDVGLKAKDDNTLSFEFEDNMSEWTTIYWLSDFVHTPIHMDLYDDVGDQYGTSEDTIASHGPFYLDYYEADKMLRFEENPNFHDPDRYEFDGYDIQIIPDDESRFQEFQSGRLDSVGVPSARYEEYRNDPRIKEIPGATVFRASVNSLGTEENQEEQFPGSDFEPEPLLAWESEDGDTNFRNALYHAWDRQEIAEEVEVTSQPSMHYFSDAYIVSPDGDGVPFRDWDTEQANLEVAEEAFDDGDIDSEYNPDDYDNFEDWEEDEFDNWYEDNGESDLSMVAEGMSTDTYGYNPDLSTAIFEDAMDDLVDEGVYELGTPDDPLEIELQFTIQSGSSGQTNYAEFLKEELEDIFEYENDDGETLAYVTLDIDPVEFPDNYEKRLDIGETDIGQGGISGSTLDAASFLENFTDDNRGGFTLDWGIDTSSANIEVTRENRSGEEVTELWSFNALTSALGGEVEVEDGEEVE